MKLRPLTDAYADVLLFGASTAADRQKAGAAGAALLALACTLFLVPRLDPRAVTVAAAALGIGAILFVGFALRFEQVRLDISSGTYTWERGYRPAARSTTGKTGDLRHLALKTSLKESTDSTEGSQWREALTLELGTTDGAIPLSREWEDPTAREFAKILARRLEVPIEESVFSEDSRPAAATTAVLWVALLLVGGAMVWPLAQGTVQGRGSRMLNGFLPLRPIGPVTPFQQGRQLYNDGKFVEAEKQFRRSIDGTDDAAAYNMVAYALAGQGRLDEALATAEKANRISPADAGIIDTVGEMHELRKEYAEAILFYQRALKRLAFSDACETNTKAGRTLIALGRKQDAIQHLTEAVRHPKDNWHVLARRLLLDLGVKDVATPSRAEQKRFSGR